MNWNLFLKYLGYAFVLIIYGAFAWTGKTPVEGFVVVLTGVLAVLGASHVSTAATKAASDAISSQSTSPVAPSVTQ